MYSKEKLEFMKQKLFIEYRLESDLSVLHPGTLDSVPEDAFGATISHSFPVALPTGEFNLRSISYNLWVGNEFNIKEVLKNEKNNDKAIVEKLKNYDANGIKRIVATKYEIIPLEDFDLVYCTKKEMAKAIAKIYETFNLANFSIENVKTLKLDK